MIKWCERFSEQNQLVGQFSAQKSKTKIVTCRVSKASQKWRTSHVNVYKPAQAQQAQYLTRQCKS